MATKKKTENKLAAFGVTDASIETVAEHSSEAAKILAFLQSVTVDSPKKREWASTQLSNVRALLKTLEEQRTSITKPILAAKRGVDNLFAPATKTLAKCEDQLRAMLRTYDVRLLEAERSATVAARAAFEAGDVEAGTAALATIPDAPAEAAGHSTSMTWRWVVESFADLPDEHKAVNERSLDALVKAHLATGSSEPPSVPGVRFEIDAVLRAKAV